MTSIFFWVTIIIRNVKDYLKFFFILYVGARYCCDLMVWSNVLGKLLHMVIHWYTTLQYTKYSGHPPARLRWPVPPRCRRRPPARAARRCAPTAAARRPRRPTRRAARPRPPPRPSTRPGDPAERPAIFYNITHILTIPPSPCRFPD